MVRQFGRSRQLYIAVLFAALAAWPAVGQNRTPDRLAVVDFAVTSNDPRLAFVGKGLAEMLAVELAVNRRLALVERERRAELLGELEFALSAAAAPSELAAAGRLLAADYLVFGSVVDMGGPILVTCRLVAVASGEIVWNGRSSGRWPIMTAWSAGWPAPSYPNAALTWRRP
jgi:TolB-like protein